MGCHPLPGGGIITLADIFHYKGFTFEWHAFCGPMKCRRDGEPHKGPSGKRFYEVVTEWHSLPKAEREKYRIYG